MSGTSIQSIQGQTAKQTGSYVTPGVGEFADNIVTELQPRFYEQTYRGNTFSVTYAANAAAAASATATGLFSLFNPVGSGKNLVLLDATVVLVSFSAATTPLQLALQPYTYTPTTVTAGNVPATSFIGSGTGSVAKTYTAGTLVGASTTAIKYLGSFYLDLAAGDVVGSITYNFDGKMIIGQGSGVNLVGIATIPTNTVALDFTWMEILP